MARLIREQGPEQPDMDWHPEPEIAKADSDPDATILKKPRLREQKEQSPYLGFALRQTVETQFGPSRGPKLKGKILSFKLGDERHNQGQMCAILRLEDNSEFTVPLLKLKEWNQEKTEE